MVSIGTLLKEYFSSSETQFVITKGDSTISAVLVNKVQQIIADCCASCNFKTNSGNIDAINYYSSFRIHVLIY